MQIRLTGASSYGLFTYQNNEHDSEEWKQKLEKHCFKTVRPTPDMVFGTEHESTTLSIFQRRFGDVPLWKNCGLLINEHYPWFGYSADAFVTINDETCLLEAKCPKLGKTLHGLPLLKKLPFLQVSAAGTVTLKERHMYYGQVQLGMALCNLKKTYFLIYMPCNNDIFIIDVPLDRQFVRQYTSVLFDVYFDRLLPFLTANSDRLKIMNL